MEIRVGKYRTRDGRTVDVTDVSPQYTWGVCGVMDWVEFGVGDGWRVNGRFYEDNTDDPRDLVERIEGEPAPDSDVADAEFVAPENCAAERVPTPPDTWPIEGLAVPNAGAAGVDVSAASIAPPGPTIRDVVALHVHTGGGIYRTATDEEIAPLAADAAERLAQREAARAETAAFESATEEANRHAFAALRALTRALNRHGIAPDSEVADAHAFALLVLDGFES